MDRNIRYKIYVIVKTIARDTVPNLLPLRLEIRSRIFSLRGKRYGPIPLAIPTAFGYTASDYFHPTSNKLSRKKNRIIWI